MRVRVRVARLRYASHGPCQPHGTGLKGHEREYPSTGAQTRCNRLLAALEPASGDPQERLPAASDPSTSSPATVRPVDRAAIDSSREARSSGSGSMSAISSPVTG